MKLRSVIYECSKNLGRPFSILSRSVLHRGRALHVIVGPDNRCSCAGEVRGVSEELCGVRTVDLLAAVVGRGSDVTVHVAEAALVLALHEQGVVVRAGVVDVGHEGVLV